MSENSYEDSYEDSYENTYEISSSYSSSSSEEEEHPEPIKYVFWNGFLLHEDRINDEVYIKFKHNELEENMFGNKFFKDDKFRILFNEMIKISNLLLPHLNELLKIDEKDLDLSNCLLQDKYDNLFRKKPENIETTENYKKLQKCLEILKDYETKIKFKPAGSHHHSLYSIIKFENYNIVLNISKLISCRYLDIEIRCMDLKIEMNLEDKNFIRFYSYKYFLSQSIYDIYHNNFEY